jgi:hypothetical protein
MLQSTRFLVVFVTIWDSAPQLHKPICLSRAIDRSLIPYKSVTDILNKEAAYEYLQSCSFLSCFLLRTYKWTTVNSKALTWDYLPDEFRLSSVLRLTRQLGWVWLFVGLLRWELTVTHKRLALSNLVNGRVCPGAYTAGIYQSCVPDRGEYQKGIVLSQLGT